MDFNCHSPCPLERIPELKPERLGTALKAHLAQGWRLLCLTAVEAALFTPGVPGKGLLCILLNLSTGACRALRTAPLTSYPALTPAIPQAHMFEREVFEQHGIEPVGHPWLKPVRFITPASGAPRPLPGNAPWFKVEGPTVHEVAVGPIHAGVIEPGHFRFQCYGERVMYLEIGLGFQHRGLEGLLRQRPLAGWLPLVECAAGDASVAHATAHATLVETLAGVPCTPRGAVIRAVGLELERLACHTGDLGAMGGDVGYLPTSQWCGRIRGDFLNLTALICGNRFGRGLVRPGGVSHDIEASRADTLRQRLKAACRDVTGAVDLMLDTALVLDRFEGTGVVPPETAHALGLTGVAGRASGQAQDVRASLGDPALFPAPCAVRSEQTGDVLARARVRRAEIDDAVRIIEHALDTLPATPCHTDAPMRLAPGLLAVSLAESWRGPVCHVGISGPDTNLVWYKIVDPSFHNWTGLAMALRNGEISDFPLCNKSFNLSYCGHDL